MNNKLKIHKCHWNRWKQSTATNVSHCLRPLLILSQLTSSKIIFNLAGKPSKREAWTSHLYEWHMPSQMFGNLSLSIDCFSSTNNFCYFEISLLVLHPNTTARPEALYFILFYFILFYFILFYLFLIFFEGSCTNKGKNGPILCQNDLWQQNGTWLQPYLLALLHYDSHGIRSRSKVMWAEELKEKQTKEMDCEPARDLT